MLELRLRDEICFGRDGTCQCIWVRNHMGTRDVITNKLKWTYIIVHAKIIMEGVVEKGTGNTIHYNNCYTRVVKASKSK